MRSRVNSRVWVCACVCAYVRVCARVCVCVCVRGFNCHVMGAQKCGITAQVIRPYAFTKKAHD